MSRIKSAWEIALEKTENIVADADAIRKKEKTDTIRRIFGSYLNDSENHFDEVKEKLSSYGKEDLKEAVWLSILPVFSLPQSPVEDDRYVRFKNILSLVTTSPEALTLYDQITAFASQYPKHRETLLSQLRDSMAQSFEEKKRQMASYGEDVRNIRMEDDPEFVKIAEGQLERLNKQYNDSLEGAKAELKNFVD